MTADPLLDYLEATFAEAYRKEIDQEENVWRSLPFFVATLALQLAGLAQVRDWTAGTRGALFVTVATLLAVAAVATFAALMSLAFSVWPADFRRVAPETEFRAFAQRVRVTAKGGVPAGTSAESVAGLALITVKAAMAEQLAVAVERNRLVNARRAKWRTRAGLATLVSVFVVLVLVALVVLSNIHGQHGLDNSDR